MTRAQSSPALFSDAYGQYRKDDATAVEDARESLELELQARWRDAVYPARFTTEQGHRVIILAPGWWNRLKGPDFVGAQIDFNGTVYTGDVEIHRLGREWYDHGHHRDPAYEQVLLHVVTAPPPKPARAASGREIPTLVWQQAEVHPDADAAPSLRCGDCAAVILHRHPDVLRRFLALAGEWRLLDKARRLRERTRQVGPDQALYEAFMAACGYSSFKEQFREVAKALPYERARQLAQQDPLALEAALFRVAGLLPEPWPSTDAPPRHYQNVVERRQELLSGLRPLILAWPRSGTRPANNPERRLAGAARFLARTADRGLHERLDPLWRTPMPPGVRRRALEDLFGGATGFWAQHYVWTGKQASRPGAPLGAGRILSILGNVLAPAALAWARHAKNRVMEENVHAFLTGLPKEPENSIHRTMAQWMLAEAPALRLNFVMQQGLLQVYEDWCGHNPSCRNCTLLAYLRALDEAAYTA